jgi:putative ABC transport system substrate-binding protein
MKRREFITFLGGAAAAWPVAATAQQRSRLQTIGYLSAATRSARPEWIAAFLRRLYELGWIEGRTVTITYQYADGHNDRLPELAADLVQRNVDVIVTPGSEAAAARQATSLIPIIFIAAAGPVDGKLVSSLARPGGNITGLSMQNTDLAGKRLELLRELVPSLSRVGVLTDVDNSIQALTVGEARTAARALGIELVTVGIKRSEDIAPAFEALKERAEALYVLGGALFINNDTQVHTLAVQMRLPAIYNTRESVEAGGLMSYGASLPDLYRRAADYVDKVLRGTKPADIPVQQPTKYDLVINLKTAKTLGLTVPPSLLARADEVIE